MSKMTFFWLRVACFIDDISAFFGSTRDMRVAVPGFDEVYRRWRRNTFGAVAGVAAVAISFVYGTRESGKTAPKFQGIQVTAQAKK